MAVAGSSIQPGSRRQAPSRTRERARLPRQRRGTTPQMIGRYPDYDVLDHAGHWDDATRRVVLARLAVPAAMRFFAAAELPTLFAFCDVVTGQDHDPRIPVAEMVDHRLAAGRLDGFQYDDMPDDREAWHLVLAGLEHTSRADHDRPFAALAWDRREAVVERMHRGDLNGGPWDGLNVKRAFSMCMRHVLSAFYAHPWAWNEIGFGGPAYPEGYMRLGPLSVEEPHEQNGAISVDPVPRVAEEER